MLIVSDFGGDYSKGVPANLKLEQYSELNSDRVLFYGYDSVQNKSFKKKFSGKKQKILLNLWTPCEYMNKGDNLNRNAFEQVEFFDKIYTICPYTIRWHRKIRNDNRYNYIFHPFDASHKPSDFIKDKEVCYFGGIHSSNHEKIVSAIKRFNYRLMSLLSHADLTNYNVSHKEKLNLIAKTRISICYNILPLEYSHINYIKNYKHWERNEAFRLIHKYMVPQYKCRAAEAAFCKSLLLVKKDSWNLIEHYFTPGEDFVYFDTFDELPDKIEYILNNYADFKKMVDSAYKKSFKYTAASLIDIIKSNKEWKSVDV